MFRGEILRAAREKAGYTLIGLSQALKEEYGGLVVDYTTLSHWEISPTAAPRKGNIKKLAEFLNISLSDLYDNEIPLMRSESEIDILNLIERIINIYKVSPNDERIKKIDTILMWRCRG